MLLALQESTAQRDWLIPAECFHVDNCKLMDWVADCTIELINEHGRWEGATPQGNASYADQQNPCAHTQ